MGTNYREERSEGVRVSDAWTFRGLKTVILENKNIRLEILADKGADISSFVHKSSDTEFMFKTPWGIRNPKNNVPSTGDGTVKKILVNDGQPVEFGQPLIVLK